MQTAAFPLTELVQIFLIFFSQAGIPQRNAHGRGTHGAPPVFYTDTPEAGHEQTVATYRAADFFCQATDASSDFAFVDLGFMRAKARYALPPPVLAALEAQPRFRELLAAQQIDDGWRDWLVAQLNALGDLTGITVTCDDDSPAAPVR